MLGEKAIIDSKEGQENYESVSDKWTHTCSLMVVSWTNAFLYCYVTSRFFLAAADNVNTRVHEEELPHSQETTQGMEASESVDTTVPRESKGHSLICLC